MTACRDCIHATGDRMCLASPLVSFDAWTGVMREAKQHSSWMGPHTTYEAALHSFTEAIKAVYPQARFQADHFHTVKHIWGHLKKSLLSYRRTIKAQGDAHHDEHVMERAKTLWKLRWSLLKKPANLSLEEKQAIAALEREDAGFGRSCAAIAQPREWLSLTGISRAAAPCYE